MSRGSGSGWWNGCPAEWPRNASWGNDSWNASCGNDSWNARWDSPQVAVSAACRGEKCWQNFDNANMPDMAAHVHKQSRRTEKLGQAFKNYRRNQLYRLKKAMHAKANNTNAKCLDDRVWNEDDMDNHLHEVASFDTHKTWWYYERESRRDPDHKLHGKDMPRLIPPS